MDNKKNTFKGKLEVLSLLTENIPDFLAWHLMYLAIKLADFPLKAVCGERFLSQEN